MPKNGIIYDLLIADLIDTNENFQCVMRAIECFNSHVGKKKGITIVGKRLRDQIFAESGGEPRDLVYNQIEENEYDMMIIVFWKDYSSFEKANYVRVTDLIEIFTKSGKQIFAYFLNESVPMFDQKPNEISKLMKFLTEYKKNYGILIMVQDEQELQTKFYSDIIEYFRNLEDKQKEEEIQEVSETESIVYAQKGSYYLPYGCIGRDKRIKDLKRIVENYKVPIVIKGVAGVGKTAFCSYYQQKSKQKLSMLLVNLENCMSKADFIHAVCEALRLKEAFMELDAIFMQLCTNRSYDAFLFDNWEDFQCAAIKNADNENDWHCVCRFINSLAGNGFQILISSQEKAPNEWLEFFLDVLEPEHGRNFFVDLLKRKGKNIRDISKREKEAFEALLIHMENHPLTMVLTASLIEGPNDTLERIENEWSRVCDRSAPRRHQSMEIALKMSYDTISSTPGAITLWGMIAEINTDFPFYYIDVLQQLFPETVWDEARKVLSDRSLIQFSENAKGIHMLMPVKAQWKHFTEQEEKDKCLQMWSMVIEYVTKESTVSEHRHNPELCNEIRGIVLNCMRSFMAITGQLIKERKFQMAGKCIDAMQDYYEPLSDSAYEFLNSLPLEEFSPFTKGLVMKCKGDICRLGRRDKHIVDGYYNDALIYFEECKEDIWSAQVLDVMGKNQYWNFHDAVSALDWIGKSEALSRKNSYRRGIAEALKDRAIILTEEYEKYAEADGCLEEAHTLFHCLGDYQGIAHVLKRQGVIMWRQNNFEDAIRKYEEALAYYKRAHYIQGQGDILSRMCIGYMELGKGKKLDKAIVSGEKLMNKIPYQMTKNDLADSIKKGKDWLRERGK